MAFQFIYRCSDESENGDGKKGREWRLPSILYEDVLFLSEEGLKVIVGWFVEVCRRGLKVSAGKSKVMIMN